MKFSLAFCSLVLILAGCEKQEIPPKPIAPGGPITTEGEAIAVVLAEIQRSGGDPHGVECSARQIGDRWEVIAERIPAMPGGHTYYTVSKEGAILDIGYGK